jgi:glycosyltransferase involved in cell wall biosynthesis
MSKIAFLTTIFPMKQEFLIDFFSSLENQTYKDFDIIVVNDGYKDFEAIRKLYQKLNIIELKYSNTIAKNREFGINWCKKKGYDILIFGDSDDYFEHNRIEKSIELLKDYDIVVNDLSLFDENGIYEEKYISNRVENNSIINLQFIEDKNIFGMTNTAVNLQKIKKINFSNDLVAVDWFLFKELLKKKLSAIFTNETLSYYRQYPNNTVGLKKQNNVYYFWWEKV